jgi:hypothetical protein
MSESHDIQSLRAEIEAALRERQRARREAEGESGPQAIAALEGLDLHVLLGRAETLLDGLDEDIARHPRLAVLAALALGVALGSLLSR